MYYQYIQRYFKWFNGQSFDMRQYEFETNYYGYVLEIHGYDLYMLYGHMMWKVYVYGNLIIVELIHVS